MGAPPYSSLAGRRLTNPDGTVNISCKQCGRVVVRARTPLITSISQCAVCQGYPEEYVLSHYTQQDPTKAPIPWIDPADEVTTLYPEERLETPLGKWGWLRPLFRAVNWIEAAVTAPPPSKAISKRKKNKGLFEREEEEK